MREGRGRRFLLAAYCLWSGITCTAAGAWASSWCSGQAKGVVWVSVSAVFTAAAGWMAGPALALLHMLLPGNRGSSRG